MVTVYSRRLDWSAPPSAISEVWRKRRALGEATIDLTLSNPTQAGFEYPQSTILKSLGSPGSLTYTPDPSGLAAAREAIAEVEGVPADRILLTASTSEAYSFLFKLLCDPGDEVLIPRPSYPLFEHLAALESVVTPSYPLFYDHGWHIDRHALEAQICPQSRAIVLVNPNNPTGSYISAGDLEWLQTLGLPLISDEVFFEYSFPPFTPQSSQGLDFRLNGLSKLCGLPQMKLGWIVVKDSDARERLEWIADTYLSVGTPVQNAARGLLAAGGEIRRQIQTRTQANLRRLEEVCAGTAIRLLNPQGGWSAVIDVPRTRSEEDWVIHLLEHGVAVQPGFFYDFDREAYLVLSLLVPESDFRSGLDILVQEIR